MKTSVIFFITIIVFMLAGCSNTSEPKYPSKAFFSGKSVRVLTVRSNSGLVTSTLEIPSGVDLSVYSSIDAPVNLEMEPIEIKGNVSIRTKLSSDIKNGPLQPQFIETPFRLDLNDALVKIETKKEDKAG